MKEGWRGLELWGAVGGSGRSDDWWRLGTLVMVKDRTGMVRNDWRSVIV